MTFLWSWTLMRYANLLHRPINSYALRSMVSPRFTISDLLTMSLVVPAARTSMSRCNVICNVNKPAHDVWNLYCVCIQLQFRSWHSVPTLNADCMTSRAAWMILLQPRNFLRWHWQSNGHRQVMLTAFLRYRLLQGLIVWLSEVLYSLNASHCHVVGARSISHGCIHAPVLLLLHAPSIVAFHDIPRSVASLMDIGVFYKRLFFIDRN